MYTDHKYEFVKIKWEETDQKLDSGDIDLFGTIGVTEERLELYEFTDQPFGYEEILLTALEGSDILFDDIEPIINKNVSALEDTSMLKELLNEYLAKNSISLNYSNLTYISRYSSLMKFCFKRRRIDKIDSIGGDFIVAFARVCVKVWLEI